MSTDDKARKAAEENARTTWEPYTSDQAKIESVKDFLDGVAWARANPEWIRKSERPPEFGERLLVAYGSGDFTYLECCEGRYNDDGSCEVVYRDEFGDLNDDEFTHYMLVSALPPAPGGE
jgi:hypothetical protein